MKKRLNNEKGQSMVEFALIMPILLLIIVGIIEFGFMFSSFLTLTNASREAVRALSLGSTDASATQRAKDSSMNLDPTQLVVIINPSGSTRSPGDSVTVTITYEYDFLTPFMEKLFGSNFQLKTDTTMRVE